MFFFFKFISGLVVLGAVEAVSMAAAGAAGIVGGVGAGYAAQSMWQDASLVDRNYKEVLKFIVNELFQIWESDPVSMSPASNFYDIYKKI
jgi:hypothetical protein